MSAYMTWDELAAKYPGAATKTSGNPSELMKVHLPQAQAEIDGYLAAKYSVPFTTVPPLVKDLCIDLVYYKININKNDKTAKAVKDYYDKRMAQIIDGTLKIVLADGTLVSDTSNYAGITQEYHSAFGPDDASNWQPDSDALDDAEDDRSDD